MKTSVTSGYTSAYWCQHCNWETSGIPLRIGESERHCPRCNALLVHCRTCAKNFSTTRTSDGLHCDSCGALVKMMRWDGKKKEGMPETILSGIRASGRLHFGNFFGAVQNFVNFQHEGENHCFYFIADFHTLTTLDDPETLRSNLIEIVKDYLAAGLDPERSIIYTQSSVPELAELCLYLSMTQPVGELQRIPTYKEKIRENPDNINLGLLTYPVLMAADILGPKATLVPVGEDQVPNVELARALAKRFNDRYGNTFAVPRMMEQMARVPGLAGGKMGKSEQANAVDISLPISEIRALYQSKGVTDPQRVRKSDPGDPYNRCISIYPVHELITEEEKDERRIAKSCMEATIGCLECKNILVDSMAAILEPFQERRAVLDNQNDIVVEILHEGGKKARAVISETVAEVREKMGIIVY